MQRWVLEQNIARFQEYLAAETDEASRSILQSLLLQAERELALLKSASFGARVGLAPFANGQTPRDNHNISQFRRDLEKAPVPCLLLHPGRGLHIVDVNDTYARATMIDPAVVAGRRMFDVFPDNPDDPYADGVSKLLRSLQIAAGTGLCHSMKIQRYDVRNADGVFVERYWRPRNTPILNDDGQLLYLLHRVEDVTGKVMYNPLHRPVIG